MDQATAQYPRELPGIPAVVEMRQRTILEMTDVEMPWPLSENYNTHRVAIPGCRSAYTFTSHPSAAEGTCEVHRLSDHLHVAATNQRLRKTNWIRVYGDGLVSIRLVLSGNVRWQGDELGTFDLPGPKVSVFEQAQNYILNTELFGGLWQRVVTMIATPEYLRNEFGWSLAAAGGMPRFLTLSPTAERLATEIVNNPYQGARRGSLVQGNALQLLCALSSEWEAAPATDQLHEGLSARDADRIRGVRDVLGTSYHRPASIAELSRLAGMNKTKLMCGFKQMFGETIADHCRRLRLDEARTMLSTARCSIGEVAAAVGYEHQSSFTAAFSAYFGFPPKAVVLASRQVARHGCAMELN